MVNGKTKGRILILLLTVFSVCLFGFLFNANIFNVKAVSETEDFFMVDGAQVRVNFDDETYQNAIRFTTKLDKTALPSSGNVKIVTMIVKSSRLTDNSIATDNDFTKANLDENSIPYKEIIFSGADLIAVENGDYYVYNACVVNLIDTTIPSDLSARSYIEVDGDITYYTAFDFEKNSTNMWDIAKDKADEYAGNPLYVEEVEKLNDLSATFDITINGYTGEEVFHFKRGTTFAEAFDTLDATFSVANESVYYGPKNVQVNGVAVAEVLADKIDDGIFGKKDNGDNRTDFHKTTVFSLDLCKLEDVTCDTETLGLIIEGGVVTGVENKTSGSFVSKFGSSTIIVPSSHGGNSVTAIGTNAFSKTVGITHVVLPESVTTLGKEAFSEMASLQTVVMPGVTAIATSGVDRQFVASSNLSKVVIGRSINVTRATFNLDGNNANTAGQKDYGKIKLYSTTIGGSIWLTEWDYRNDAWDRDVCYCWAYEPGTYEPVATAHKYIGENGICEHCGHVFDATAMPDYTWDSTTESYFISGSSKMTFSTNDDGGTPSKEVTIPSWYNDGVHGDARVTRVLAEAFKSNTKITYLSIPSTVTTLGYYAFAKMTALKTVKMTGALNLTTGISDMAGTWGNGMFFADDTALENIIFGPNVYSATNIRCVYRTADSNDTMNVFCTDDSGADYGTARGDGLRNLYLPYQGNYKTETYYYYRATAEEYNNLASDKKPYAWHYAADGITPVKWAL